MDVNKTWKRKIIAALVAVFAGTLTFMPFGTAEAGLSEEIPVFESGVRLEAPAEGAEKLLESRTQKKFAYAARAEESFEDYLLEAPNFTKIFNQKIKFSATPSEYSKGNHSKISGLKKRLAICKTKYFRPDLYQAYRVFIEQQQLNNKVVK